MKCRTITPFTTLTPFLYPALLRQISRPRHGRCSSSLPQAEPEQDRILQPPESDHTPYRPPSTFQDTRSLILQTGAGGHGCISFLREKFIAHGPPNGGDGGKGGDIYIQAVEGETSLHKLGRTGIIKAGRGAHGQGSGKNGKRGMDVVIKVPVGTVVREIERMEDKIYDDDCAGEDGMEEEENQSRYIGDAADIPEDLRAAEAAEEPRRPRRRPRRFAKQNVDDPTSMYIHYPLSLASNLASPSFPPASVPRPNVLPQPPTHNYLDLSMPSKAPILLIRGSAGGYGNPHFITPELRRPKFATKGGPGSRMKVELELKLLADIGLVGRPNVGKSSLLRCLTASRARVGNWAFTTLVPNVGTVVLDKGLGMGDSYDLSSKERFTIADIPGLIRDAGQDKGLGWDFLRHVERAKGLAFVIDLSCPDPVEELETLWEDIRGYETMRDAKIQRARDEPVVWRGATGPTVFPDLPRGITQEERISKKPWMVVANKADLEGSRDKFMRLRGYLDGLVQKGEVEKDVGCVAISALKAGSWEPGEVEREEEMWKGLGMWLRGLVG